MSFNYVEWFAQSLKEHDASDQMKVFVTKASLRTYQGRGDKRYRVVACATKTHPYTETLMVRVDQIILRSITENIFDRLTVFAVEQVTPFEYQDTQKEPIHMENQMTQEELQAKIDALELPAGDERIKSIVCSLIGHSHIVDTCFGYVNCARCDAQVGDTLGGTWSGAENAVIIGHYCDNCRKNYATMGWRDTFMCPDPFAGTVEQHPVPQPMRAWTYVYNPFVIGGKVNQATGFAFEATERVRLGHGYYGYVLESPRGGTIVVEERSGAIVGSVLSQVIRDVTEGDTQIMEEQVEAACKERVKIVSPEEFWKIYRK